MPTERIVQVRKPGGNWEFGSKVRSAAEAMEHQVYVLQRYPDWAVRTQPIMDVNAQMTDDGLFQNRRKGDNAPSQT